MRWGCDVTARPRITRMCGQAMTEFVIAATFVLVPLFVFVPMLAKYIDFKHASIQAARYQAWEYTVWYNDLDERDITENFNSGHAGFRMPLKAADVTRHESQVRIMGQVGTEPAATTGSSGTDAILDLTDEDKEGDYVPNPLWRDRTGLPFFDGTLEVNAAETNDDTPTITIFGVNVGSWINAIIDVVDIAFGLVGDIIGVLDSASPGGSGAAPGAGGVFDGSPAFTAINTDGYSHVDFDAMARVHTYGSDLRTRLDGSTGGRFEDLGFKAKAGVLADGWNAGGTAHAYLQVGGATPATLVHELLSVPGLSEVWDLVGFIAPELSRCDDPGGPGPHPLIKSPLAAPHGHLWLGYVDGDVVHPDRLSELGEDPEARLGTHVCDDSGRCVWSDEVRALDPPMSHSPCRP